MCTLENPPGYSMLRRLLIEWKLNCNFECHGLVLLKMVSKIYWNNERLEYTRPYVCLHSVAMYNHSLSRSMAGSIDHTR